jgi:hypothetical protein
MAQSTEYLPNYRQYQRSGAFGFALRYRQFLDFFPTLFLAYLDVFYIRKVA